MEKSVFNQIKKNWDSVAKPLDSMGKFENLVAKVGAVQNSAHPKLEKAALLVLCADNGIVEEGVSQSGQEVTATCARNIAAGKSSAAVMAAASGVDVITVDLGIATVEHIDGVVDRKIRPGTRNFIKEPAMTSSEFEQAFQAGKQIAHDLKNRGYDIACIGEMGIGNTTTSAVVAASLLGLPAENCTGRGAGLSNQGLLKKISVIETAIKKYDLYKADVKTVLCCAGGFDIVGMAGFYTGAYECNLPVILDGAISSVSALAASRMQPEVRRVLISSHKSREILSEKVMQELSKTADGLIEVGFSPVIDADMALGEGTGALMMLGLLRTALCVYENAVKFEDSGVEQYTRSAD